MTETFWIISIAYDPTEAPRPRAGGLYTGTPEHVHLFAQILGKTANQSGKYCTLSVEVNGDTTELDALLQEIEYLYGFKYYDGLIVPLELRREYFCVKKTRVYHQAELDNAEFLLVNVNRIIGEWCDCLSEDQIENEQYVVDAKRTLDNKIQFGSIFPLSALAVGEEFKSKLEQANLDGLNLSPVIASPSNRLKKKLWKFGSDYVLPRSQLRIVGLRGESVEFSPLWNRGYFDDAGTPVELIYSEADFRSIGPFDIAMTAERLGCVASNDEAGSRSRAVRRCVVSQKFREFTIKHRFKHAEFSPVRFV